MTILPTPAQLVALGLSETEAWAVVSALVLLEHVPEERLKDVAEKYINDNVADDTWDLLDALCDLRRLLPERTSRRCVDDKGTRGAP